MPGGHQRLTESADEKGAATSPKNRQLPPRRKARKQCEFPRAFTCSHPANGPQPPPLRYARRRLVPCGHAPALAARKKAARPVRPRTRPCRRQEGGSSCAATHPPLRHVCGHAPALAARKKAACPVRPRTGSSCPATDRLVLSGHGPGRVGSLSPSGRVGSLSPSGRVRLSALLFCRLRRLRPWSSAPHLANF